MVPMVPSKVSCTLVTRIYTDVDLYTNEALCTHYIYIFILPSTINISETFTLLIYFYDKRAIYFYPMLLLVHILSKP